MEVKLKGTSVSFTDSRFRSNQCCFHSDRKTSKKTSNKLFFQRIREFSADIGLYTIHLDADTLKRIFPISSSSFGIPCRDMTRHFTHSNRSISFYDLQCVALGGRRRWEAEVDGERAGVDWLSAPISPSPRGIITAALSTLRWWDKEAKLRFFILFAPSHSLHTYYNLLFLSHFDITFKRKIFCTQRAHKRLRRSVAGVGARLCRTRKKGQRTFRVKKKNASMMVVARFFIDFLYTFTSSANTARAPREERNFSLRAPHALHFFRGWRKGVAKKR